MRVVKHKQYLALVLLVSSSSATAFGGNAWGSPWGDTRHSNWPVWTPMYWVDQLMNTNRYGRYNRGYNGYAYSPYQLGVSPYTMPQGYAYPHNYQAYRQAQAMRYGGAAYPWLAYRQPYNDRNSRARLAYPFANYGVNSWPSMMGSPMSGGFPAMGGYPSMMGSPMSGGFPAMGGFPSMMGFPTANGYPIQQRMPMIGMPISSSYPATPNLTMQRSNPFAHRALRTSSSMMPFNSQSIRSARIR